MKILVSKDERGQWRAWREEAPDIVRVAHTEAQAINALLDWNDWVGDFSVEVVDRKSARGKVVA